MVGGNLWQYIYFRPFAFLARLINADIYVNYDLIHTMKIILISTCLIQCSVHFSNSLVIYIDNIVMEIGKLNCFCPDGRISVAKFLAYMNRNVKCRFFGTMVMLQTHWNVHIRFKQYTSLSNSQTTYGVVGEMAICTDDWIWLSCC